MSAFNDEMKLKIALQTAIELRTCPDEAALYSTTIDSNLRKHLSICHACREKRSLDAEELNAWKILQEKFPGTDRQTITGQQKQSGQVWMLAQKNVAWREDGRFFNSPAVLLLNEASQATWAVSQLYHDKRMMGDGDVPLAAKFGFAEGWNCYAVPESDLCQCLGTVTQDELSRVVDVSKASVANPDDNSILSIFRSMELEIAAFVAVPSMTELEMGKSKNEVFLQNIFGSMVEAYDKLTKFKLPEYADSLIDLLSGATDPHGISPVVAATSIPLQVNIIIKQMDGAIIIKTVCATLTESNWEDGDYYIAGKLNEPQQEDLFLLASLNLDGSVVCECQNSLEKGSPYFDILFKSVAKEASSIENLKFILVRP